MELFLTKEEMKKNLYLQERPKTFEEFVGHKNNVEALINALNTNRLSHAYLFYGSRGTGKTSLARIFAKAINCESTGKKPCNECPSCLDPVNTNIIEIDAASNNGVEQIRKLIENSEYNSIINNKTKIYIIDEVHMLTKSAFNAFLKTLEEPKEKVIFILITTEIKKIPPTIVSRTQTYNFNSIPKALIAERIKTVADQHNYSYTQEAIEYLATISDGSLRDALNILEKLNLLEEGITLKALKAIKNYLSEEEIEQLIMLIKVQDKKRLWMLLCDIDESGNNPHTIMNAVLNKMIEASLNNDDYAENYIKYISKFILNDSYSFLTKELLFIMFTNLCYEEPSFNQRVQVEHDKVQTFLNEEEVIDSPIEEIIDIKPTDISDEEMVLSIEVSDNIFDYETTLENATKECSQIYNLKIKDYINTHKTSLIAAMVDVEQEKLISAAATGSIIILLPNDDVVSRLKDFDLSQIFKKELKHALDIEVDYYPVTEEKWVQIRTNWINNNHNQVKVEKPSDIAKKIFGDIVEVK